MKTLKFAVLLLAMLAVCSCGDKDDTNNTCCDNSLYQHSIWISFQDASGNDLTEGIGCNLNGKVDENGEVSVLDYETRKLVKVKIDDLGGWVKPELYTLEYVYEEGIPNPWKPEPKPYVTYHEHYPDLYLYKGLDLPKKFRDYNYLWFDTGSYRYTGFPEALLYGWSIEEAPFAEKIIFRLTCPYLFGDDAEHDIVTWWEPLFGNNTICSRVEYDGKECLLEGGEESYPIATIILDR